MPNRSRSAIVNMDGSPPDYTPEHTEQPAQRKRRYIAKGYYLPALAICATVLATVLLIHYLPPNYPKYPKLHYQLKDTCKLKKFACYKQLTYKRSQIMVPPFSITSITSRATIQVRVSYIMLTVKALPNKT